MHSPDLTAQNIDKIAALFPGVVTESRDDGGNPIRAVDFDLLRQELSDHVVEGPQERYRLDWPGKREALFAANAPIAKTLRPAHEESINFDTGKNLFIEGDSLDALKLLQESYLGEVKLIYIDPPYNTGNDFVYDDDFAETNAEYLARSGQMDEEGNRLVPNTESNGRFHSDWLSMMYARLKLAKTLLTDDGVIFISIDDTEQHSLKAICLELFGERNFVGQIVWKRKRGLDNSARFLSRNHEYLLVFARNADALKFGRLPMNDETKKAYRNPDGDPRGQYRLLGAWARGSQGGSRFAFTAKSGEHFAERLWLMNEESMRRMDAEDRLVFVGDKMYRKLYLTETRGAVAATIWDDTSNAANAADEIKAIFGRQVFDTVKPLPLIDRILRLATSEGDGIVLDFFAGSGTTAEAVMRANHADGGSRSFICVQLDEPPAEGSVARAEGYDSIADIAKERIRRASRAIAVDSPRHAVEWGFRSLKVDSTNLADVRWTPDKTSQTELIGLEDSVKSGRSDKDLLFEILLSWGLELTMTITAETVEGHELQVVEDGALIACFADEVGSGVVREIAGRQPLRAVFRDSGFATDADRINAEQIFAEVSPVTDVKVI